MPLTGIRAQPCTEILLFVDKLPLSLRPWQLSSPQNQVPLGGMGAGIMTTYQTCFLTDPISRADISLPRDETARMGSNILTSGSTRSVKQLVTKARKSPAKNHLAFDIQTLCGRVATKPQMKEWLDVQ